MALDHSWLSRRGRRRQEEAEAEAEGQSGTQLTAAAGTISRVALLQINFELNPSFVSRPFSPFFALLISKNFHCQQ